MDTAIVIGGGPAGLIAASHLADAGITTTLLEARARFGGRAASDRQEGFVLNQGPHALYVGGPAMRELAALGVDPPRWNPVKISKSFFIREGRAKRLAGGFGSLAKLMRADAPPDMTAAEWIAAGVKDPGAHELAAALVRVTTFVADHDVLPADVAKRQLQLGAWPGVRYIEGGWQWLVDALSAQAERRGATLRTRAAVRSLERTPEGWTVTTDEGEHVAATVIVATGLPSDAAKLVGDIQPPGPPAEISSLDLGLRRLPKRRTFALGLDEPTYLSKHSPPGHTDGVLMSAMSYARAPLTGLERIADTVLPGWRDEVIVHRHLPKMVAIGAIASPTRRPGVSHGDGIFLAGDWVGGEGWLVDAALASGAAAAAAAIAKRPRQVQVAA